VITNQEKKIFNVLFVSFVFVNLKTIMKYLDNDPALPFIRNQLSFKKTIIIN